MFEIAAETYDRFVGRYAPALARELIAYAGVQAGDTALDVGCGPGALTTELAVLLGAASVTGVEPSEPFAAAARSRLPEVRIEVARAESLPFDDGSFDRVLAQLVVNFLKDAPAGLSEMRRVCRPGGSISAAVWDYGGGMTMLRRFWDAVIETDPTAYGHNESRMHYSTPEELSGLWTATGLKSVTTKSVEVTASYTDFADLWAPFEQGVGPAGAYTITLDDEARSALRTRYHQILNVGEAPFTLPAKAWLVTGTLPTQPPAEAHLSD